MRIESRGRLLTRRAPLLLFATIGCVAHASQVVTVDGRSVYVDDGGRRGVPVVFIHGNGGSSLQWAAQLAHLRGMGRRALAIDLPGFGQSPTPLNNDFSLDAMATAVESVRSRLGLQKIVLIAHSYGGAVAATYAAKQPQNVAGIVYIDAVASAVPLTAQQSAQLAAAIRGNKMQVVKAMFTPLFKTSSAAVQQNILSAFEQTSPDAILAGISSLREYEAKVAVQSFRGPRLAIVSTDIETPMSFRLQFPEIEAVKVRGAGHWLMLDKPDVVNDAIGRFLESVR